jgi:DDE_Tnp_1-associated
LARKFPEATLQCSAKLSACQPQAVSGSGRRAQIDVCFFVDSSETCGAWRDAPIPWTRLIGVSGGSDGGFVSVFSQAPASPAARSLFANQGCAAVLEGRLSASRGLFLVVCATIANCDDYDEIVEWGDANLAFLRGFSEFYHGIPCVDWLGSVMNRLDPDLFRACFSSWVAACWPDSSVLWRSTAKPRAAATIERPTRKPYIWCQPSPPKASW